MSVYVGINVHRKRSRVAVVGEDGRVQLNRNVVNGPPPMLGLLGGLPPSTRTARRAQLTRSGPYSDLEGWERDPMGSHWDRFLCRAGQGKCPSTRTARPVGTAAVDWRVSAPARG
jgi:hypothetical protein